MAKVKIYNIEGKVVGERALKPEVFGVKAKKSVVHQVVVDLLAKARGPWAHTKTRGDVSGGGKKPWKQKGTGRARQGSTRSPIWVGGGITFGPRSIRNYDRKVNRKLKKLAFVMALSDKLASDKLVLLDELVVKDGKTKVMAKAMSNLPVSGKLTVVVPGRDELVSRASRNLPKVNLVGVGSLGLLDVLNSDAVVLTVGAAEKLEKTYGKEAKKA
ncbi:MAG: 50S ribosomal protein L4 [Patescibacteria group bacterium]|nr:50S ribosomal protein L4 [Patescibacteria group bacterium]